MSEPLVVSVALPASIACMAQPEGEQQVRTELQGLLADLVHDLGLPLDPRIELVLSGAEALSDDRPVEVRIGERRCRVPAGAWAAADIGAVDLARRIARIVHENRRLLVTAGVAAWIQATWASSRPRVGEHLPGEVQELLARLAEAGQRLDQAPDLPAEGPLRDWERPAAAWFEHAVRHQASTRVGLAFGQVIAAPETTADEASLDGTLELLRDGMFYELGLRVPLVERSADPRLAASEFRVRINGVRLPPATGLGHGEFLVNAPPATLQDLGVRGVACAHPVSGQAASVVRELGGLAQRCKQAGWTVWGPRGFAILALSAELRRHAAHLMTAELVELELHLLREAFPALVDASLRRYPLERLAAVLRALLAEGVCVRNLRGVLEGLLPICATTDVENLGSLVFLPVTEQVLPVGARRPVAELSPEQCAEGVRIALRQQMSHQHARGRNTVEVVLVAPAAETRFTEARKRPLSAEEHERWIRAAWDAVGPLRRPGLLVLTSAGTRRAIRESLRAEFPQLPVLSFAELVPQLGVEVAGRITWPAPAPAARIGP